MIRSAWIQRRLTRLATSSASMCSENAVNPETSANKTVTCFRRAWFAASCWLACRSNSTNWSRRTSRVVSTTASPKTKRILSCASMAFLISAISSFTGLSLIECTHYKLNLRALALKNCACLPHLMNDSISEETHRIKFKLWFRCTCETCVRHYIITSSEESDCNQEGVEMVKLNGKVAVVTGASRGVGKGIALGLGEAGATVYVTGRTGKEKTDVEKLGGTVFSTAEAVTAMGGKGVAILCDHNDDAQTETAFKQIAKEGKKIDILVNNAWAGYEKMREGSRFTYFKPFWEQPFWRWDAMFQSGVRAAYTSSAFAARMMTKKKSGLIVNISFWSAQLYLSNAQYGASKAAVDKLSE